MSSAEEWGDWAIPFNAAVVSSFGCQAPAERPSSSTGTALEVEPVVRSKTGRPVHFGPQTSHVTQLRERQAAEQARRKAEKERKDAEVAAAKSLLAAKKPHRKGKMTAAEKDARKRARQLLRACEKKGREGVGGGGSTEAQRGSRL